MAKAIRTRERGAALLLTLFALLLLSAIGLLMVLSSDTETRIDANYSSNLSTYYAARSGVEEVRDRMKYPNSTTGGLSELLPQDIAGNLGGVLYITNPAAGEAVDPTDPANRYFDTQLCHDYPSGVPNGSKCMAPPSTAGWNMAPVSALPSSIPVGYKWVRINIKTNGTGSFPVDSSASLASRVCWDGQTEQVSPGGVNPACDANGMQTVYMVTAMAANPGPSLLSSSKVLRAEVVAPSIRPAGAVTMDALDTTNVFGANGIPATAIDGRVYDIYGNLSTSARCSRVAPIGTDNAQTTGRMTQSLDNLRQSIVQTANNSCNADGTGLGGNLCSPGLWWVRGTDPTPRFITSGGPSGTPTPTPAPTPTPTPLPTPDDEHHGHDGHGSSGPLPSTPTPTPIPVATPIPATAACDPSNPACYTNLDLGATELYGPTAIASPQKPSVFPGPNGIAPFIGATGNQADPTVYQSANTTMTQNSFAAMSQFVNASKNSPNYYAVSSAALAPVPYGSSNNPAVVVITDSSLKLSAPLTGFGVLVVPNDFEINSTLQWTGVVMVQGAGSKFLVGPSASGYIRGTILLQSSSSFTLQSTTLQTVAPGGMITGPTFGILYSCDAIDLVFGALPLKVVGSSESSF